MQITPADRAPGDLEYDIAVFNQRWLRRLDCCHHLLAPLPVVVMWKQCNLTDFHVILAHPA